MLSDSDLTYLEIHAKYNEPSMNAKHVLELIGEVKNQRLQLAALPVDTSVEEIIHEHQEFELQLEELAERVDNLETELAAANARLAATSAKILSFPVPRGRPGA